MKNLDQVIGSLPADRRAKVKARGRELIAEEIALQHLRQARHLTQQSMAKILGIGQDRISKIENRSDMLHSTLRTYVEAMGGSLRLIVEFLMALPCSRRLAKSAKNQNRVHAGEPRRGRRRLKLAQICNLQLYETSAAIETKP